MAAKNKQIAKKHECGNFQPLKSTKIKIKKIINRQNMRLIPKV